MKDITLKITGKQCFDNKEEDQPENEEVIKKDENIYEDYQNIFRRIVKEGEVTEELKEEIYAMMLDIFYYDYYHLKRRFGSLSRFEEYTYADISSYSRKIAEH